MTFALASFAAWLAVVAYVRIRRGKLFAIFAAVILGVQSLIASALAPHAGVLFPGFAVLHALVFVHFGALATARMRPLWYRAIISMPGSFFSAGTFLALPWAIAAAFGADLKLLWMPYAFAAFGLVDSFLGRRRPVHIVAGTRHGEGLKRAPKGADREERPLRVAQITDPHLGPFMTVERLRGVCERIVAESPDLVVLTGDFLTMESHHDETLLARALAPLKALEGRTFACLGNHDYEALDHVRNGLSSAGVKLLVDESARVTTEAGEVEVVGFDFHFRDRARKLNEAMARVGEKTVFRLALLHDPGAFRHLPEGSADLVLSGHTHGGQVGLLWLGLPHTMLSAFSSIPDHGLWSRGSDLLYVHRGTGHYGFPIRVGVPPEESVLHVHRVTKQAA